METTPRFKMVNGNIKTWQVSRFAPTNKTPDYTRPQAKKIISAELTSMAVDVKLAESTKSKLITDQFDRVTHRVGGISTFPKYMREAGISSKKDFNKVMDSKKGVRFKRLEAKAIERLNHGFKDSQNYSPPDKDFLVASNQIYDRKDVIFRRVRGRLIPMKVPKSKRTDLMEEAPF